MAFSWQHDTVLHTGEIGSAGNMSNPGGQFFIQKWEIVKREGEGVVMGCQVCSSRSRVWCINWNMELLPVLCPVSPAVVAWLPLVRAESFFSPVVAYLDRCDGPRLIIPLLFADVLFEVSVLRQGVMMDRPSCQVPGLWRRSVALPRRSSTLICCLTRKPSSTYETHVKLWSLRGEFSS